MNITNIKPGDLFEWVYKRNNEHVHMGEELYSYALAKRIPCAGLCLCVGINDGVIYWISNERLCFVGTDEASPTQVGTWGFSEEVVPQKIKS